MAKKFVDKDNLEQILESIDKKYLDKNEYYSILNNSTSPTDEYLLFIDDKGDINFKFNGSQQVSVDLRNFKGKDGRDATNQFISYVFCSTKTGITPDRPYGGDYNNPIPTGPGDGQGNLIWHDVPKGEGSVFMSKRMFSSDGNHDDQWSEPSLWQDTSDFQVEYSSDYNPTMGELPKFQPFYEEYSNIKEAVDPDGKESQRISAAEREWRYSCENEGYGNWSDNIDNPIYMATCFLKDGIWSDWVVTRIEGESKFESVIYKRSFDKPTDKLEGGDYNNPYPNNYNELGWSTDISAGLGRLWRSHRLFISDGSGDEAWSDIQLWQDYPGFQVEYSTDFDMTKKLPNFDQFYQSSDTESVAEQAWRDYCENNNLGTWGDSTDNAKYMATCSLKDGSWTDWVVTQVKGESSNHLELSNEFDQIYVIDNKPIVGQSWSTTISYFEGSTKIDLDSSKIVINVPKGFQSTINGNNLEISLDGEPIITDDIKISIKYNDHEKILLLKRFEGNIDYDLYASSTFYKCDSEGNVTSNDIDVYIISKEVGTYSKIDEITSIDNSDFKLVYKGISNNTINVLQTITTGEIIDLTKENYLSNKYDSIRLELYKGKRLLDLINIEKLIDGKDGADGDAGISSFLSTVYIRSYNTPATPSGGSYDSPRPDSNDWSDGIPSGSLPLWSSHRTFSSDGKHGEWSKPILLADSYHFQVEYGKENVTTSLKNFGEYYKNAKGDISIAETNWRLEHDGWSDSTEDAFYMATCSKTGNNTWSDWLVTQIKGEKGDAGQFTEFRYCPSGSYTQAPELVKEDVNPNPEVWSTTIISTPAAPYIWMTQSIKSGDGKLIKTWSTPVCINIPGKDGSSESGLAKIPYYAGVVDNSTTYTATDHTTPYVTTSKGEAYVLITETSTGEELNEQIKQSENNETIVNPKWALMEQYQALFAELAIIENGTLGSAVFYKDFMYSKIGISGNEVITTFAPYDSSGNKKSIDTIITDNNRPSYLVDLATGEGYYAGGVIKFNKDSAQLGKFIVDSNGFTYAEQGSWGYESNMKDGEDEKCEVTSLRSYCPNAKTINVNLKRGTVPYGTYPLEGRINAKKGTTVKFDNKNKGNDSDGQSFVVDDNNVLTYLTEPNEESGYTVKVINNIKYVNVNIGTQLVKYTLKFNIGETAFDSIVDSEDANNGIIDKIPCWINCYSGTGANVNDTLFYNDKYAQLSKAGDYYIIELQVSNPIGSFQLWLKGKDDSSWLYPSIFNGPMPAKFDSNNIMIVNDIIEDFN